MTQGQHRQPCDRYAELAMAQLINTCGDVGFVISRLPTVDYFGSSLWIVNIGSGNSYTADTLTDAVRDALAAREAGREP